jgi:osmotically-inducible protein OsmY
MTLDHGRVPDDRSLTNAITAFLRGAARGSVLVECTAGNASLRGNVRSRTARTAIEDLVLAHDGVRSVDNHLVVDPAAFEAADHPSQEVEHRR